MSILTPLQKEVMERFLTNFKAGGVKACEAMVSDLAAEVALAVAVSDGAEEAKHETILEQEKMTIEEIVARMRMLNDIPTAAADAMSRYSFALYLLNIVKKGLGLA